MLIVEHDNVEEEVAVVADSEILRQVGDLPFASVGDQREHRYKGKKKPKRMPAKVE